VGAPVLDVLALLPHRYPLLLVDAVTELDPGRRAVGVKRVTGAEWAGGAPAGIGTVGTVPHTLLVEALAQLSAAVLVGLVDTGGGAVGYFLGFDRVRFRGEARAGDAVRLEVTLRNFRRGVCRTQGVASVDGVRLVRAELTTVVRPAERGRAGA
jgi:3-hydroxyacyl-[acyl-carrier-protein] dehydratase